MTDLNQLKADLMQADIDNKRTDTAYKMGLLRYEPWKVIATSAGAGAGFVIALVALATFAFSVMGYRIGPQQPQPPIVIQLPPPATTK